MTPTLVTPVLVSKGPTILMRFVLSEGERTENLYQAALYPKPLALALTLALAPTLTLALTLHAKPNPNPNPNPTSGGC